MINYVTRQESIKALRKMRHFHSQLTSLYSQFDIDISQNTGRRNMLMSHTQEKFFADVLAEKFSVRPIF